MSPYIHFELTHNHLGQQMLGRIDLDGGVTGVLPGGVSGIRSTAGQINNPTLLWRIGRWQEEGEFYAGYQPAAVEPITLAEALTYAPQHATWMVERAARQLKLIGRFVDLDQYTDQVVDIQKERLVFVRNELIDATRLYQAITNNEFLPADVSDQIVASTTLIGDRFIH